MQLRFPLKQLLFLMGDALVMGVVVVSGPFLHFTISHLFLRQNHRLGDYRKQRMPGCRRLVSVFCFDLSCWLTQSPHQHVSPRFPHADLHSMEVGDCPDEGAHGQNHSQRPELRHRYGAALLYVLRSTGQGFHQSLSDLAGRCERAGGFLIHRFVVGDDSRARWPSE